MAPKSNFRSAPESGLKWPFDPKETSQVTSIIATVCASSLLKNSERVRP